MMSDSLSPADIMAMSRGNDDMGGFAGIWNNPFVYLVWMWAMRGFNGGWGNNGNEAAMQGALTRSDLFEGFNTQDINSQLRGITNGICDGFYAVNNSLKDGFYGNQAAVKDGFYGTQSAIAENRFAAQNCCYTLMAA